MVINIILERGWEIIGNVITHLRNEQGLTHSEANHRMQSSGNKYHGEINAPSKADST